MLGNFSFGDYFKKEAIHYAWTLLTEVFKLPKESLMVTVYEKDDEAYDIWNKQIGLPPEKIVRIGDNNRMAYYSNFGKTVDICAPGGDVNVGVGNESAILSTTPVDEKYAGEGKAYTCYLQGTSMSCPMVSGVAALLVSYFGEA